MLRRTVPLVCFAAVSLASATASARSFRVADLPNGSVFGCRNCHNDDSGATMNDFGSAARLHLDESGGTLPQQAHVIWADLCPGDADGDNATNGAELGDPDCAWTAGQGNPGGAVTNPGLDSSGGNAECNNGQLDKFEDCDGTLLAYDSCISLNAGAGSLSCQANCTFDYSDCSKPPAGWAKTPDDGGDTSSDGCSLTPARRMDLELFGPVGAALVSAALALRRRRAARR